MHYNSRICGGNNNNVTVWGTL